MHLFLQNVDNVAIAFFLMGRQEGIDASGAGDLLPRGMVYNMVYNYESHSNFRLAGRAI